MDTAPAAVSSSHSHRPPPRAELRTLMQRAVAAGATGTDVAVLAALWTHADRHGGAWPSQCRLARLTRRCERTVRTSVQRLDALGVVVRSVPSHGARRWGWTDPATGERRWSRRSTVYVIAADDSREPRPMAAPGASAEPAPELIEAAARVAAAIARARARDDETPELLWGEAADVALDELLEPAPRVADQEAPEIAGDRQSADQEAPELIAADTPQPRFARVAARVFARAIDRQPLPPKSPRENPLSHSLRAREAEPAPDTPNPHTSMPHRDGPFQAPSPPTQGFTRPVPVSASARPPARPPPATLESKAAALMRAAARRRR